MLADGETTDDQIYVTDGWMRVKLDQKYCLTNIRVHNTPALGNHNTMSRKIIDIETFLYMQEYI